ncbi:MAG: DUF192 domain-containing protein, partial [Deltaproteobacteria bacterium]|nr:DUF192 domain-containing protein [Deltaproteobacteria bacterium]
MRAVHLTSGSILAKDVSVATNFFDRACGLLGRRCLPAGQGLYIPQCSSIHMFFMRFPIDVMFMDKHNCITGLRFKLAPFRLAWGPKKTAGVLELPAGTLKGHEYREGDKIEFI